jgi:hypothetical protein
MLSRILSRWGFDDFIPIDDVYERLFEMEEKYDSLLLDVKRLEEENIETTNSLYEVMNCLDALDARIDILAEHYRINKDV